jgi:hypothetical protein
VEFVAQTPVLCAIALKILEKIKNKKSKTY